MLQIRYLICERSTAPISTAIVDCACHAWPLHASTHFAFTCRRYSKIRIELCKNYYLGQRRRYNYRVALKYENDISHCIYTCTELHKRKCKHTYSQL